VVRKHSSKKLLARFIDPVDSMLKNKNIIITGAASGIGRASSKLAADFGAQILCVDLSDAVHDTAAQINESGGRAISLQADVRDMSRPASPNLVASMVFTRTQASVVAVNRCWNSP